MSERPLVLFAAPTVADKEEDMVVHKVFSSITFTTGIKIDPSV